MKAGQVIFIQWTSLNNCVVFDRINSVVPDLGALVNGIKYLTAMLSREKLLYPWRCLYKRKN